MFTKDKELSLRAVEPTDSTLLYQWENDPGLWQVSDRYAPLSYFEIDQFILNNQDIFTARQLRLMVDLQVDSQKVTIGIIDIYDLDICNERAGIGILIDAQYSNKGYGRRALILAHDYCFKVLKLHQVYSLIAADNLPSLQLFKSLNYQQTAKKTDWIKRGDTFLDQYQFQLLKTDQKSKNA